MKEVGIRELKANASRLVREVAEENAVYAITRRGRPVGILAPPDFIGSDAPASNKDAWAKVLDLADRIGEQKSPKDKSALGELSAMRR